MAVILQAHWKEAMLELIAKKQPIKLVTAIPVAIKWLIIQLEGAGIPFKLTNLGAGVKVLTTDTDICPCCKRKL